MLRPATAVAFGLIGALITLVPATAVAADAGTTTTTGMPPTTTSASTTTTTARPTTTSARTTTSASPTHAAAATPHASQDATVTISTNCAYFCFAPAKTTVVAGGTVTWVDKSGTKHNITRCDPANCSGVTGGTGVDAGFTSAHLAVTAGGTAHFTFTQPGTYVYYCAIHGYALMHGSITVVAAEVTTVPVTAAPVVAAPIVAATAAPGPHLASTGSGTGSAFAVGMILLVLGLTATSFRLRRRFS